MSLGPFWHNTVDISCLQCFNILGWGTERACSPYVICFTDLLQGSLLETSRGPSVTWSNLWKNKSVKRKLKLLLSYIIQCIWYKCEITSLHTGADPGMILPFNLSMALRAASTLLNSIKQYPAGFLETKHNQQLTNIHFSVQRCVRNIKELC